MHISKNSASYLIIIHICSFLINQSSLSHRSDLCGYNLTLTYPQNGHFKTLDGPISDLFQNAFSRLKPTARRVIFSKREMASAVQKRALEHPGGLQRREASRQQWKRDLSQRPNGTIDPYYGCALYDEMVDYALNFSLPWSRSFSFFSVVRVLIGIL